MANDLQKVADIAIDMAAVALRNNSIFPMLVSRDLDSAAAQKNQLITVPVWHALDVNDVTPGTPPTPNDLVPMDVEVRLSNWKEVPFVMTDKQMAEVVEQRVLPEVIQRAVIKLADTVNLFIAGKMARAGWASAKATSSAAIADIVGLRKLLQVENVDPNQRSLVVSPDIAAELLILTAFHEADKLGSTEGLVRGALGQKFGFTIAEMSNGLGSQTAGDFVGTVNGVHAAVNALSGGYSDVALNRTSGTLQPGDVITFAAGVQKYSVLGKVTNGLLDETGLTASGTVRVMPAIRVALADTDAVAYATDHDANFDHGGLAFHKSAFAFATRPLVTQEGLGVITSQTTDPVSGLSLRMQVRDQYKQRQWSLDLLYGGEVVYSEAIARLQDGI